ncbi:MAG TPA: nuclear transport factor 2 family protein [Gemmatimonadaceae bacterium]
MRPRTILSIAAPAALVAVLVAATAAPRESADEAAIRQTVQLYFDGGEKLNQAFHADARMLYAKEGHLKVVPIADFIAKSIAWSAKPKDAAYVEPVKRVASIDVAGNAAIAKLEITKPGWVTTDYMSLLKVDGQWVIVNKIFDSAQTTTASR